MCGEGVSGGGVHVEMRKERMKVLAVEHALRRETQRASQLSQELKRLSIKGESPTPLSPGCTYKVYIHVCIINGLYVHEVSMCTCM